MIKQIILSKMYKDLYFSTLIYNSMFKNMYSKNVNQ